MSRKYCEVCRAPHQNPHDGLCDLHRDERDAKQAAENAEEARKLDYFMSLPEENRWQVVFSFMREHGWSPW